ncbi:MAG: 5'-nucleotidase C-terminal domain-containing protein, partial [bacterium]
VDGIDVILGGHTHDLIKNITKDKNLFYSKKTGEPTIITQAGRDGNYFGILNLEFNDKGVITKAQNNVSNTEDFSRSPIIKYFTDKILGKPEVLGTIKTALKHKHSLITENPSADFVLDAERNELGVDMVLINSGNFRFSLESGSLTDRDLKILTPFDNKVWIIKLTEKEIVDSLKIGAKSLTDTDNSPGIMQCSGLKYAMSKSGEVKNATFIDKDGKETPINIKNPNPFKTYTVATDDYIAKGGNNYFTNKQDAVITKFNFDKNKLVGDYMKKTNKPVDIKTDGRIKIVD